MFPVLALQFQNLSPTAKILHNSLLTVKNRRLQQDISHLIRPMHVSQRRPGTSEILRECVLQLKTNTNKKETQEYENVIVTSGPSLASKKSPTLILALKLKWSRVISEIPFLAKYYKKETKSAQRKHTYKTFSSHQAYKSC